MINWLWLPVWIYREESWLLLFSDFCDFFIFVLLQSLTLCHLCSICHYTRDFFLEVSCPDFMLPFNMLSWGDSFVSLPLCKTILVTEELRLSFQLCIFWGLPHTLRGSVAFYISEMDLAWFLQSIFLFFFLHIGKLSCMFSHWCIWYGHTPLRFLPFRYSLFIMMHFHWDKQ